MFGIHIFGERREKSNYELYKQDPLKNKNKKLYKQNALKKKKNSTSKQLSYGSLSYFLVTKFL